MGAMLLAVLDSPRCRLDEGGGSGLRTGATRRPGDCSAPWTPSLALRGAWAKSIAPMGRSYDAIPGPSGGVLHGWFLC